MRNIENNFLNVVQYKESVFRRGRAAMRQPPVAGGLLSEKSKIVTALAAGALCVSAGKETLRTL